MVEILEDLKGKTGFVRCQQQLLLIVITVAVKVSKHAAISKLHDKVVVAKPIETCFAHYSYLVPSFQ